MENNIGLILSKRAHLSPAVDGFVDGVSAARYSFHELNLRSNRTAHMLRTLGVNKGERVAFLLMNSVEFMESFFAVAKIGAVIVPLNWRLVADELEFILKDSGAKYLIFDSEFSPIVSDLRQRGERTQVQYWIQVLADQQTKVDFALDYNQLQSNASPNEPEIGACDDDLLYIMYTSGTTGLPKGAVHTHNTSLWACITINATADIRLGDRFLHLLPMFHVGALTPVTWCVYTGTPSIIARSFDPEQTWQIIEREHISVFLAVPSMLNFMWQVPHWERYDYARIRWCLSGASPVPVTLIENFASKDIEIHQVYGLTETCGTACLIDGANALKKAGSTGKAFFHTKIRVVDSNGADCASGVPGEVLVSGRHLMKEYWNHPEASAEAIVDGWLRTGDIATMDDEGFVYIMDRTKDMIISGGENIYPAEIENVILSHPGIAEVAVIGQPSARWGESPFAVVVPCDGLLQEQEVIDYCVGKIARFKLPKGIAFIEQIPRNPSGKVLKRLLRDQFPGPACE